MTEIHNLDEMLSEWAENVIVRIQENLDSTGTTASGKTKESLEYELTDTGVRILGRQYFRGVEEGRPAGGIPYKFQDILYDWAKAKGILSSFGDTESKQRSALYMVGQFIKNNGSKLYREGGRTDIYSDVINEEVENLTEKIFLNISESIVEGLQK